MKIENLLLLFALLLPASLLAIEKVEYSSVMTVLRQGESLSIDSFLGEKENFEKGKQYKVTGTYQMLPFTVNGVDAPKLRYRIAVWGVEIVGGNLRYINLLGDYASSNIQGNFDFRFTYEECDLLILTMAPINSGATGGMLISDGVGKRKNQRIAEEHAQKIFSMLTR